MKTFLVVFAFLFPGVALAAGGGGAVTPGPSGTRPTDPVLDSAIQAMNAENWPSAQGYMKELVSKNPGDAEFHNMYAYSLRKGQNPDMSLVFKHYNEALRLDPKHRGANEYLGEAYLMVGNLPKAKEQLATLDKLCFFPCKEFSDLKKSIADYEARKK